MSCAPWRNAESKGLRDFLNLPNALEQLHA